MRFARPGILALLLPLAVVVGSTAACRKPAAKVTAEPDGSSTVVASSSVGPAPTLPVASVSASAAARPIIEPPIFPTPPTPPGADSLEVEIASAICKASKMKTKIGCQSHPPFTKPEQMPDGTLPEHPDPDVQTFCGIDKMYKGSFTAPGKSQVLVSFEQCKDDSGMWDGGNPGSGVVVEKTDGAHFRVVAYEPDINLGACKISHLKKADRDTIFCRSGFSAGAGSLTYFTHIDFTRAARDKRKARTVAYIFDDEVHCGMMNPMGESEFHLPGFAIADVKDFAVTDVNGDETPDLVLTVHRAALAPSPSLDSRVKSICNSPTTGRGLPNKQDVPLIPKSAMKPTKIEIVSAADETFAPTPASKKLLNDWVGVANSGATQCRVAAPPAIDDVAFPN